MQQIIDYFDREFSNNKKPVGELSQNKVKSSFFEFDFDAISLRVYGYPTNPPTSTDSIRFDAKRNTVIFIEFKSGFIDKIGKIDEEKLSCPYGQDIKCREYAKILKKNRKLEKEDLVKNLRLKAIESYMTFTRMLLPCIEHAPALSYEYQVFIDDGLAEMESVLNKLGRIDNPDNIFSFLQDSLQRLKTSPGKPFYFKSVQIKGFSSY